MDYSALAQQLGGGQLGTTNPQQPNQSDYSGVASQLGGQPLNGSSSPSQEGAMGVLNTIAPSETVLGQGLSTVGSDVPQQSEDQAAAALAQSEQLIQLARRYPISSPQRSRLLQMAAQGTTPTASDINPAFDLSNKQVLGAGVGVLSDFASFGKAPVAGPVGRIASTAVSGAGMTGGATAAQGGSNQQIFNSTLLGAGLAGGISAGAEGLSAALTKTGEAATKGSNAAINPELDLSKNFDKVIDSEKATRAKALIYDVPEGDKASKVAHFTDLTYKMDAARQTALDTEFKGAAVPTSWVQDGLRSIKELFINNPEYDSIAKKIDKTADGLNRFGDTVPFSNLNQLKIQTADAGFQEYTSHVSDELKASMSDVYKTILENQMDLAPHGGFPSEIKIPGELQKYFNGSKVAPINEFNSVYGDMITAKYILSGAKVIPNKTLQLLTKYVPEAVGATAGFLGGHGVGTFVGDIVGRRAGEILSSKAAAPAVSKALGTVGKISSFSGRVLPKVRLGAVADRALVSLNPSNNNSSK